MPTDEARGHDPFHPDDWTVDLHVRKWNVTNIPFDYAVVIPTRGRKSYLEAALESVYAQSIPPSQVVVVIDGDTDETATLLRSRFPQVEVIEHSESLGASASRNAGLRTVRCEWVALLDDDDIWHSRKQEAFHRYLQQHPGCRAMRSGFWQFSEPGAPQALNGRECEIIAVGARQHLEDLARTAVPRESFSYLDIEGRSLELMLHNNRGVTSTTVFRRDLLDSIPDVPDDLRTAQDWLLFVFLASVTEWHLVPGRWMFYRVHQNQITSTLGPSRWRYRLRAWRLAWEYAGWPSGYFLDDYAPKYASEIHRWLWGEIRALRLVEAIRLYRAAESVVQGKWLRRSMLLPPPVRWRLMRKRMGMVGWREGRARS